MKQNCIKQKLMNLVITINSYFVNNIIFQFHFFSYSFDYINKIIEYKKNIIFYNYKKIL